MTALLVLLALSAERPNIIFVFTDDHAAHALGSGLRGLRVRRSGAVEGGLEVAGDSGALAAYTIALGQAGIALRSLERRTRSL